MYDFLIDLDDYFCEKYAHYDKICALPGYRMPKMQTSRTDEWGRTFAYTLPADTMRLALQENKQELLKTLKERIVDKTFSFSFVPLGIFKRIKYTYGKFSPKKELMRLLGIYKITAEEAGEELAIDSEIWKKICKGKFKMTKNTILSLALTVHFTFEETQKLLAYCEYEFDYTMVKDVVIAYLLQNKVYNRPMIDAALQEYKVANLFIK